MGEGIDGLEAFHPERMADRILGMGDVLTLIEKAEQTFDQEQAEKAAAKMQKGQFTLEDFLEQFQALKRMGSLKDVLAMLPGAGSLLKQVNVEDRDLARVEGIIRSMTPEERRNPKLISGSRKRRIAAGSGRTPTDVNQLLKQFGDAQRMMKMMAGGKGMPSLDGIAGMGGGAAHRFRDRQRPRRKAREGDLMAVKMRLIRIGKKKQPVYRIVVIDGRAPRDGRYLDQIGRYDPRQEPSLIEVDSDKAIQWMRNGAQPTDRVRKLLEVSGAWARFKVATGKVHTVAGS